MIDEKKIEQAANKHVKPFEGIFRLSEINAYKEGFKVGINWYRNNLWHDASEEPKEGVLLLTKYRMPTLSEPTYDVTVHNKSISTWRKDIEDLDVISWLYIDDLLKGCSHE